MPFVVDASVTLAWHFDDESSEYADRIFARLREDEAVVPSSWPLEVANALLVGERRGRISVAGVEAALRQTLELTVSCRDLSPDAAFGPILDVARLQRLTIYDAIYLHLAMHEGLPLATLDEDLKGAAQRVGVNVID
jgi:predicted nucleic acid-binding protein